MYNYYFENVGDDDNSTQLNEFTAFGTFKLFYLASLSLRDNLSNGITCTVIKKHSFLLY